MLTAAIACYRAWRAEGGAEPAAVAGHSLGEYSALVAAGALTLADALPLVRFRAQAMQQAVPVGAGAMAAILGLDAAAVAAGCAAGRGRDAARSSRPANFNDPKQTVIAGSKAGVDQACEAAQGRGRQARAAAGGVGAVPFVADEAGRRGAARAAGERGDRARRASRWSTTSTSPRRPTPTPIRDALYRQAFGPVRWVEVVQALRARGLTHVLECGPGKVLAGHGQAHRRRAWRRRRVLDPASLAEAKGMLA